MEKDFKKLKQAKMKRKKNEVNQTGSSGVFLQRNNPINDPNQADLRVKELEKMCTYSNLINSSSIDSDESSNKSISYPKKYFFLNAPFEVIRNKISVVLIDYLGDELKVNNHLKYHLVKYLYVIDRILRANAYWKKRIEGFHFIDYQSLYFITNHKSIQLKNGDKMTLARMLTKVLIDSKLLKRSNLYSKVQKKSYEYKVLKVRGYDFMLYPLNELNIQITEQSFLEKISLHLAKKFYLEDEIAKKLSEWMEKLDFSQVKVHKLSKNHQNIFFLFEESKFQVFSDSGRFYNSFTNLPKTIRKFLRVEGEPIGELDMANAQAIFLNRIILERLENLGVDILDSTREFIIWSELGKAFEFLNDKKSFKHGKTRKSFKESFWAMIMDSNDGSKSNDLYSQVYELIPQILDEVEEIKRGNYKKISYLLQKEESRVIQSCYKEIMNEVISSTLHDGIYFQISKKDFVVNNVIDVLRKLQIKCTLKWDLGFRNKSAKNGIEISFPLELDHLGVIENNPKVFRKYPLWKFDTVDVESYPEDLFNDDSDELINDLK
ncbi:hypothetical protein [Algoriphagus halophilus]|uniref:Uncharacterized protein n=1 Tax=Algoriphagus halophilus TaxID=226505 RepID=A0A1N6D6H1_9BACT|nr:hypothetical protein [Algoriphagus halophilus]SIN66264.1 hypothetical protein SAMN05444394_0308 [Algoriphagus halophilus]